FSRPRQTPIVTLFPYTTLFRSHLNHIIKGGKHLLRLINEVLELSRIEAGRMTLSLEPIAVGEVVHEALDLVRPLATETEIDLILDRKSTRLNSSHVKISYAVFC